MFIFFAAEKHSYKNNHEPEKRKDVIVSVHVSMINNFKKFKRK